jgi:hypothetical protein
VTSDAACSADGVAALTPLSTVPSLSSGEIAADRRLIAGATETLCVQVSLPAELATEFQDSAADLALNFAAVQDPDNPHGS